MVHPDPHHPGISALVSSPSVSGSASASYIASSAVLAICLVDTVLSIFVSTVDTYIFFHCHHGPLVHSGPLQIQIHVQWTYPPHQCVYFPCMHY